MAQAAEKVQWALKHIAGMTLAVSKWEDTAPKPKLRASTVPFWRKLAVPPSRPHRLVNVAPETIACMTCGAVARSRAGRLRLRRECCKGLVVARVRDQAVRRGSYASWMGHAVVFSRPLWWCLHCGAYTRSRLRGLGAACPGQPRHKAARKRKQRLMDGIHPFDGTRLEEGGRLTWSRWKQMVEKAWS